MHYRRICRMLLRNTDSDWLSILSGPTERPSADSSPPTIAASLRLRFGSVRDLIIGVTLALADGTLASSGGKVVKNVAGYDLPKLVTGALGTLGIITRAVFRLHPLPQNRRTLTIPCADMNEAQRLFLQIQDSKVRSHRSANADRFRSRVTRIRYSL